MNKHTVHVNWYWLLYYYNVDVIYVCVCVYIYHVPNTCDKLPYTLFISIQFEAPWRSQTVWPKHVAALCHTLNTNTVQPVGSDTCAYRTAAQKVNSSKRIVTRRLNKDCSLWNYCCQLNEEKFDLGSGCTKGGHTLWYLWKITCLFQSETYLTAVQLCVVHWS
jgi:hypothetical protein